MTDLTKLDIKKKSNAGARLYFNHPTNEDEKLDLFMDVLGRDSTKYKNLQKEKQLKLMNSKIASKKQLTMDDLNEAEEDDIDLLSSVIVGVGDMDEGKEVDYITFNDKKLTKKKKDVIVLLDTFPFMKEQVTKFLWDRANFL